MIASATWQPIAWASLSRLARVIRRCASARSICCTVARETPARAASCDCDSPSAMRISRTQPARGTDSDFMRGNAREPAVISARCCSGPRRWAGFFTDCAMSASTRVYDA